jgi:putative heme iron utilization protein
MNADHRDAMNLYATRLLGAEPADWCCTGCDPDGLDMRAGATTLRLDFLQRIVTPAALRQMLKQLADQARAATIV